jgi:hypothetical protein
LNLDHARLHLHDRKGDLSGFKGKLQLPVLLGGLRITVDGRIPLVTKTPCVISIIGGIGIRGGSHLCCRLGIAGGAEVITTAKSNGSAKGDERTRTYSVLPLKAEALARREILFQRVIGDVLAAVHTPLNAVLESESKGRRSCTTMRVEAEQI